MGRVRIAACSVAVGLLACVSASPAMAQQPTLINPVAPASPPASSEPATQPQPGAPLTLDGLLDALDERGQSLDSFTADITLTEIDGNLALETHRSGKVWYQRLPDGDARFRVAFTDWADEKIKRDEKLDYVLEKGRLIERNHRLKTEVRRQVLQPGQKMNLIKLGEGPFPLPIGQKKEEVKRQFDATLLRTRKGEPAGTQHLELRPKKASELEKRFSVVDIWVDLKTRMPVRVDTVDPRGNSKSSVLTNLVINPKIDAADFTLPPVELGDWNVQGN